MYMNCEPGSFISRRAFLKGAGVVGAAAALAACGGGAGSGSTAASAGGSAAGGDAIADYVSWETANREIETWNILYSQAAVDFNVLTNLVDGLISYDTYGKPVPALAESWEHNEDATVWTFHLRQGVKWVDQSGAEMADLTAADFLTGFEWVLNQAKNEASNTSMPNQTVLGAAEYYDYTAAMAESDRAAAEALTYEDMIAQGVGISAPDDYTLVLTCTAPCPYFDTVASYACLYPAAPALVQQLGVEGFRACSPETMWYCGPYIMDEYIMGNSKHFVQNPLYWDESAGRFNSFTVRMIQDTTMGLTLYESGELDDIDLNESMLSTIYGDEGNQHHDYICEKRADKYSYQFHFNYQKNNPDGTPDDNWNKAIANTAFRQCFHHGLDITRFYSRYNMINPLRCENNCYTMPGVCYNTQGVEYTELVKQKLWFAGEEYDGESMIRLRGEDISALKAQAMEELGAIGVTFPVSVDYYVMSGDQTALDNATVLRQCFADSLGEDFVTLNICTYVSSFNQEVRNVQLQAFQINGWGADFGDPVNFVGQEILHDDNAYYACHYSNVHLIEQSGWADWQADLRDQYEEFTRLVNEAAAISTDVDARYEAFAVAEAYMLEHALCVPCYFNVPWCLTHANEYSKINAMYGLCNRKYVNWETRTDAYTTAEYEAFAAAYAAEA